MPLSHIWHCLLFFLSLPFSWFIVLNSFYNSTYENKKIPSKLLSILGCCGVTFSTCNFVFVFILLFYVFNCATFACLCTTKNCSLLFFFPISPHVNHSRLLFVWVMLFLSLLIFCCCHFGATSIMCVPDIVIADWHNCQRKNCLCKRRRMYSRLTSWKFCGKKFAKSSKTSKWI